MLSKLFKKNDETQYLYVLFEDTTHSFMAEKAFKEAGLPGKLISAPSFLTAGCGLAWRGEVETEEEMRKLILENNLSYEKIVIH